VIKACETVDACLGELLEAVQSIGGRALVTADHGNSDQMYDPTVNGAHTAHTLNPVEVVVFGEGCKGLPMRNSGRLADVAPTVLDLLGLPKPVEMTGNSLIQR
jgi:2,3-bisphosphoglycerate-independent phosphoglycerate mutase